MVQSGQNALEILLTMVIFFKKKLCYYLYLLEHFSNSTYLWSAEKKKSQRGKWSGVPVQTVPSTSLCHGAASKRCGSWSEFSCLFLVYLNLLYKPFQNSLAGAPRPLGLKCGVLFFTAPKTSVWLNPKPTQYGARSKFVASEICQISYKTEFTPKQSWKETKSLFSFWHPGHLSCVCRQSSGPFSLYVTVFPFLIILCCKLS